MECHLLDTPSKSKFRLKMAMKPIFKVKSLSRSLLLDVDEHTIGQCRQCE